MAATAHRIGPADHGRALSLDEFREAEEEPGYRYELARGVLEVTEVPNDPHGEIVFHIFEAISRYHQSHPGTIHRYGGAGEFRLWIPGMISGRNPDAAVVLKGAPKNSRGRRVPTLVVEVVSRGSEARDYEVKREEYLVFGLLEYWIIDPRQRKVTVLVRDGDVWIESVFRKDQTLESLVLPGFGARVSEFWADIEDEDDDSEP